MIFLVLTGADHGENLEDVRRYREHIDGIELRADYLADPWAPGLEAFLKEAALSAILTIRKPEDGGRWKLDEGTREALFRDMLNAAPFAFVDLEGSAVLPGVEETARRRKATIIRSFHDFEGVPADLARRLAELPRNPDEIPKAAVMPRSAADLVIMLDTFAALEGRKTILLGMGEYGFPFRILAPRLGSFLTFASPGGDQVAPGLIDPEKLETVYHCRSLGPETRVFGIIGNPILHSRSPHIHNCGYRRLGMDAVYLPFQTDTAAAFLPVMERLRIGGLSVTVPFKEEVIPLCSEVEEAVRVIGACNTLVPGPGGLRGYNTDAEGFLAPLRKLYGGAGPGFLSGLGVGSSGPGFLSGLGATVLGAGGSARAAVYALAREGARVLVLNRSPERARRLVEELCLSMGLPDGRLHWGPLGDAGTGAAPAAEGAGPGTADAFAGATSSDAGGATAADGSAGPGAAAPAGAATAAEASAANAPAADGAEFRDLLVNTTTLGMHPWENRDPMEGRALEGYATVYDIVYQPRETLLLRRAAAAGCRTLGGMEMLMGQALRQFLLFTGREYPSELFLDGPSR